MCQRKTIVSVIGSHDSDEKIDRLAYRVGKTIAQAGAVLACGGLGGAMEATAKGAKESGGLTIGILPGREKEDANSFIDIAIPTTIGFARNAIVACTADLVVALQGSHGTRCEISYAFVYKRPIVDLGDWNVDGMLKISRIDRLEEELSVFIHKVVEGEL